MRVSGRRAGLAGGRHWQIAVVAVTATGALSFASQADAALLYWQDSATTTTAAQPAPKKPPVRKAKTRKNGETKSVAVEKEGSKPQGPLIISVSISQQKVRVYDANGLFAESPISTGMPGHPTPMGVFSIIQKHKFHHSNIYSGAPMPYMQRITWSGVAMHAGVVPGHPASHGCIRLPMAFAVKMWNWTKMGARVVVAPGDVTPATFAHPLLAAVKVQPQPVAVEETKSDVAAVQRPIEAQANTAAVVADPKIELRPTVGHAEDVKPATDQNQAPVAKLQTADASGEVPTAPSSPSTSTAAEEPAPQPMEAAEKDASKVVADAGVTKSEAEPAAAMPADVATSDNRPASEKPAGTAGVETAKPETAANELAKPDNATAATGVAQVEAPMPKVKAAAAPTEESAEPSKAEIPKAELPKTEIPVPAATAATSGATLKDDLKSDFAKTVKSDPGLSLKRSDGQIAVFVSRKDQKLYVRQNFSPIFSTPVSIAPSERPLGTHIFTARVDSSDSNVLHWSVVTLPVSAKSARAEEERPARGRKMASAGPIEAKPLPTPDSPSEALDRLNLPAEVMAKIYEALTNGGSLIVSDQGIAAGETGEGTDFIVSLR